MVTSWAAARAGISRGCIECATSTGPARVSTTGRSNRCQARFRIRTGILASTTAAPGTRPGSRRCFQELEKRVSLSLGWKQRQQRLRHLVRVLADPCSLDERGTIVDQDAHVPAILAHAKNSQPLYTQRIDTIF